MTLLGGFPLVSGGHLLPPAVCRWEPCLPPTTATGSVSPHTSLCHLPILANSCYWTDPPGTCHPFLKPVLGLVLTTAPGKEFHRLTVWRWGVGVK